MGRYDASWRITRAAQKRVDKAMRETAATWVAGPDDIGNVIVATVETDQPDRWREIAKPWEWKPMRRSTDCLRFDEDGWLLPHKEVSDG